MLQLSDSATLFVSTETDTGYQHTAGLVILDASESRDFCFEKFRAFIDERMSPIPQFRWKLREVPFGLDLPYWVEDQKFSLDRHVHRIAVPAPGDMRALTELAGYLYSHRLDRGKPLWELWFIEGLEGNRFAILQKLHHCMMDGQGAQKIGEALCDFEPDPPPRPIPEEFLSASTGGAPSELDVYARSLGNLLQAPTRSGRHMLSMLRPALLSLGRAEKPGKGGAAAAAPELPCNGVIGTQRGFACLSLPLADVKRVKDHFGVSVNDVVLALTATSMRKYLLHLGVLPRQSARVNMAVSLRKESDKAASNAITSVNLSLHTDRGDPVERLKAIHAETDAAKQAVRSGQSSMYDLVNSLPPFAVALLNKALTPDMVLNMMKCNFVVSNVKGSARPMYLAGARVDAMYPMSLLANGMGLNFTCVSYVDNIDFGITYDVDLLPDPWRIADGLREALAEYLQICADTEHGTAKGAVEDKRARRAAAPTAARRGAAAPAHKASTKRKAASKRPAAKKGKAAPRRGGTAAKAPASRRPRA